jgi:hypothetical protein
MSFLDWLLDRLQEKTTWLGVTGVLTAAGIGISPDQAAGIATAGGAVVSVILMFTREKK